MNPGPECAGEDTEDDGLQGGVEENVIASDDSPHCDSNSDGESDTAHSVDRHLSLLDGNRQDATAGQEKSRAEMLRTTRAQLVPLQENDSVLIPVSEFDRGRLDCRNVPGIVIAIQNDNYKIATKHVIVNGWIARNQVMKADYAITTREMANEDIVLPFRQIATRHSQHGGQGFTKCSCQGGCITKRCQCKKSQTPCHSHCHPQNKSCKNKV